MQVAYTAVMVKVITVEVSVISYISEASSWIAITSVIIIGDII